MWRFVGVLALAMLIAGVVLTIVAPREKVILDPSLTSGDVPTTTDSRGGVGSVTSAPTTTSTTSAPTTTRSTVATSRAAGLDTTTTSAVTTLTTAVPRSASTTTTPLATRPVPSLNGGDRPREPEDAGGAVAELAFADRTTTRVLAVTEKEAGRMAIETDAGKNEDAESDLAKNGPVATTTARPVTQPTPPCGGLFGLAGASTLWADTEVERFAAATGVSPMLVVGYASLTGPVPVEGVRRTLERGALPVITLEPWVGDDPIAAINRGELDDDLRRWGRELATIDDLVPIRFAHEMNGFWYPWGSTTTDPAAFRAAFGRVRSILLDAGAEIEMMWSPNVATPDQASLAEWYPGDDLVDMIGLSGYAELSGLDDATAVFGPSLDELVAIAPGLPVLLAETASATPERRKLWVDSLLRVADRPEVVGVAWFDVDKDRSWSLSADATAAARFGDGIRRRSC